MKYLLVESVKICDNQTSFSTTIVDVLEALVAICVLELFIISERN
ncbi:hypothetical protein CRENPOLYSF2_1350002 [Crenothrix polyspora]|uniref:Uncharacterized protein n=1 Tax=Crenothrix polyspora TaxID=360316 RepID=A0A1R4H0Q2_9GAMM|nr:hypothetical protein CRENPOLYSF2_1350002 [Crenothrix polyspora]